MIKNIFLILFLFSSQIFSQSDSSKLVYQKEFSISDTIDVKIIDQSKLSWVERNEGALLSAFAGLLIAFVTIYFSYRYNKKLERAKQSVEVERIKEIYKGYLFAIKAELVHHQKLVPLIRQEFEAIIIKSIELNHIFLEKPTREIQVNFLAELRILLLNSEIYNTQVFITFTGYLSKCELINTDINLSSVNTFLDSQKEFTDFGEALDNYSSAILGEFDKLLEGGIKIIDQINEDLKKLGVDLEKSETDYLIRS